MDERWNRSSTRTAKRRDRAARWIITLGGVTVIASVVAILALIVGVTLPLFRGPTAEAIPPTQIALQGEKPVYAAVDRALSGGATIATVWLNHGDLVRVDLPRGRQLERCRLPGVDKNDPRRRLRQVEPLGHAVFAMLWSDGGMSLAELSGSDVRRLADVPSDGTNKSPIVQSLLRRSDSGAMTRATRHADGRIVLTRRLDVETLSGDRQTETHQNVLLDDLTPRIAAMTMDREGNTLYAGTDNGRLIRWSLDETGKPLPRDVVRAFSDGRAITAITLALGDVSLVVGDRNGGLTVWAPVTTDGVQRLRQIHRLRGHDSPIRQLVACQRHRAVASLDARGVVHLDNLTSQRSMISLDAGTDPIEQIALSPRGDVLLGRDPSGRLTAWRLELGSSEISLRTLFGRVFYEGYDKPEYAWQTTGGEEFEPKFSLTPLVFGTLKGTLYAMLLAVPLALFGAMYVSYFTTPAFRRTIKPAVELMATVPSVVIGFMAALWLAPILERWALAFCLSFVTLPAALVAFMAIWQGLRRFDMVRRVENGYEFLVVLPVLVVGASLAIAMSGPVETWLFGGNFRRWLFDGPLGMTYDQRNCILIAFGLGFTVIPIIFSIAEDALSNVPYSMTAASMAVGASRWQTLWRVVLPSASPGIFAAAMIGFGRAVGETMIVLMATGNTPIMDWSPLNGMRTLSANIAVEIPEAPVDGTLYRVLFLCAVLLFLLTFTVNTAAELVRQRLRKRFGRF
ncbi:MAG: ABC transporter permease subunit [Planctomycetaceae bacterium]|nr:ABC transporter permease subunit [Planctomycetaceae bacterium]